MMERIAAIIISYYPCELRIEHLLRSVGKQVHKIIIVDNTPSNESSLKVHDTDLVDIIYLNKNIGIASAQNIGIKAAIDQGYTDVLLLDQDSLPSPNMVEYLIKVRELAANKGASVAAVGPQQVDSHRDGLLTPFVIWKNNRISLLKDFDSDYCECCFLIASGCLISVEVFKVVGFKEDNFFIDCVDLEWCFRAISKGYICVGSFQAKLNHELGDTPLKVLGRELTYHSPLRHYYFYRNFYSLLRRDYIPASWKTHVFIKSSLQACIFTLFSKERIPQAKMIIKGIYHGLIGKMGKYEG